VKVYEDAARVAQRLVLKGLDPWTDKGPDKENDR